MTFLSAYGRVASGYVYEQNCGVGFFRAASLCGEPGLGHGFTGRTGGVTPAPLDSLNLDWDQEAPLPDVRENFRRMCAAAGTAWGRMVFVNYEHGVAIRRVGPEDCGRGVDREPLPLCDGLVTDVPGVTLVTSHADCAALFLFDPRRRAIGLAHAGWRGVLGRLGQKLAHSLCAEYNSAPQDILAAVGPCICRDCFEVDEALGREFAQEFPGVPLSKPGLPGKAYVDLEMALAAQFFDAGLRPEHITLMHCCTMEDEARLYSYRRDKANTGSMAAYMALSHK